SLQGGGFRKLGNGHYPPEFQTGQRDNMRCQLGDFFGRDAALATLSANVYLQAYLKGRQRFRSIFRQTVGDFLSVHTMYPGKVLRYAPCFIALYGADKMPFDG